MTTYQRFKKENQELQEQLRQVCVAPNSEASYTIIRRVQGEHRMEAALWSGGGNLKNPDGSKFEGFIKWITR